MKNPPSASRSVHAGGSGTEIDMMKLNSCFRNFVNARKNETKCYGMIAKQHKYIDEEVMDYTSELVFHSVTIFFHPICYLKTQRYKCIQS